MLVLSRKVRERIRIGDDVIITITRISGNRVSVGVEAPDDVHVLRDELGTKVPETNSKVPAAA